MTEPLSSFFCFLKLCLKMRFHTTSWWHSVFVLLPFHKDDRTTVSFHVETKRQNKGLKKKPVQKKCKWKKGPWSKWFLSEFSITVAAEMRECATWNLFFPVLIIGIPHTHTYNQTFLLDNLGGIYLQFYELHFLIFKSWL